MIVATIARDSIDSPNMESNDAMILDCVSRELTAMGAEVIRISSPEEIPDGCDAVCHMSRNSETLKGLAKAEGVGIKVINGTKAVKNCSRLNFIRLLEENGIPQPSYAVIESSGDLEGLPFPAWIKRGDGWSSHKDDVRFTTNSEEAAAAITEMKSRGIGCRIYTGHCDGDIIKFYGVGREYFHCSYPDPEKSKFGLEKINGTPKHYPFDMEMLKKTACRAAEAVGLQIYGGDCIITPGGEIYIIDINDFPSFSAVREEAAKEIAKKTINIIQN